MYLLARGNKATTHSKRDNIMNKSTKFKIAHKITKANHVKGDSYAASFALALAWVNNGGYALTGDNEIIITRNMYAGSGHAKKSVVKCSAATAAQFEISKDLGDGYYQIHTSRAHELRDLKSAITQEIAQPSNTGYSSRTIVTLEYAQLMGLSHGKSWLCAEYHVELKGACPSFEGQLICYAYTA